MLSSILSSEQAVAVNVQIMRTFVRLRELALEHKDLARQLAELHERMERLEVGDDTFSRNTRAQLKQAFDARRELMTRLSHPSGLWGSSRLKTRRTDPPVPRQRARRRSANKPAPTRRGHLNHVGLPLVGCRWLFVWIYFSSEAVSNLWPTTSLLTTTYRVSPPFRRLLIFTVIFLAHAQELFP